MPGRRVDITSGPRNKEENHLNMSKRLVQAVFNEFQTDIVLWGVVGCVGQCLGMTDNMGRA